MSAAYLLMIDTHVHLYEDAVDTMLSHAAQNFARAGHAACYAMMLTETHRDHAFDLLAGREMDAGSWRREGEPVGAAMWMTHPNLGKLLVVAGGQTVTAEGIEVLSLGTRERFKDRLPIDETIGQVAESGATAVLPYGLGKWLGKRGKLVGEAFGRWHEKGVRLGDNAGRPRAFPTPLLFDRSRKLGRPVLPGSDPLRTPYGMTAAGRYGMRCSGDFNADDPAASIHNIFNGHGAPASTFGGRVGLGRCVAEQVSLRLNKKRAK